MFSFVSFLCAKETKEVAPKKRKRKSFFTLKKSKDLVISRS
jgi:hypothetical protein